MTSLRALRKTEALRVNANVTNLSQRGFARAIEAFDSHSTIRDQSCLLAHTNLDKYNQATQVNRVVTSGLKAYRVISLFTD